MALPAGLAADRGTRARLGQQPASWLVYTRDGVADEVLAGLRRHGSDRRNA